MSQSTTPGPQHAQFKTWAQARGVAINGIHTAQIHGRGLGICAKRKIKAGEEIINVPASTLVTVKSVPEPFRRKHDGTIGTHGLLASFLAFGGKASEDLSGPWKATWPSLQDFEMSMPLLWPRVVRDVFPANVVPSPADGVSSSSPFSTCFPLPPAVGGQWSHPKMRHDGKGRTASLLYKQEERLNKAWAAVSKAFPEENFEVYRYYWFVVNSRSFYWEFPGEKLPESHDDRMVLVPWADYFNHNGEGCNVSFDKDGYTITSDRDYEAGEELYISYGSHSNDYLLVEYGFIMDNKWDSLPLDDFFTTATTTTGDQSRIPIPINKKEQLERTNYWGNYNLNSSEGVCHRTQVAVRALTTNVARFKQFVAGKEVEKDRGREERKADVFVVREILQVYFETAEGAIMCLEEEEGDGGGSLLPTDCRATLIKRWKQIKRLIQDAFVNAINEHTQAEMRDVFDVGASNGESCA